jgi:hypothetical protein
MENRFKGDAKVQSFLQSLKHRKWRSAFDIPEFDVYEAEIEARMQDVKDKSKFVLGGALHHQPPHMFSRRHSVRRNPR